MTPEEFIGSLHEPRQSEMRRIHEFIRSAARELDAEVAKDMIGYGKYHYKYDSRREGDWYRICLSSNKSSISIHVMAWDENGYIAEQRKGSIGKATVGKSCVRFESFDDIDHDVLRELIAAGASQKLQAPS